VLARPSLTRKYQRLRDEREGLLHLLETVAQPVTPAATLGLPVRDPKDEKVLACALRNADYLVSNDPDLLTLAGDHRLGTLTILTAKEFLEVLESQRAE
jgi:predicted nucleic acid-binding protein